MRPGSGHRIVFLLLVALIGGSASIAVDSQVTTDGLIARNPGPAAGKFLVARREMRDPNFAKTVVLLLSYGSDGALGLVINRPSHVKVSTLSSEIEGLATRTDSIFVGGPVPAESLFVLFTADEPPEESDRVFERVHVTRSADVLSRLVTSDEPTEFRVIAGYAGWGPGQLDNEIARGDWYVVEPDEGSLFTSAPGEVWESLVPPEPTRQVRFRVPRHGMSPVPSI